MARHSCRNVAPQPPPVSAIRGELCSGRRTPAAQAEVCCAQGKSSQIPAIVLGPGLPAWDVFCVYVHVRVCAHVCKVYCACMCVCLGVHVCAFVFRFAHVQCTCVFRYAYACVFRCHMYVVWGVYVCIRVCICV